MALDPRSFALGIIAAHAFSLLIVGLVVLATWWRGWKEQKERDRALDQLIADVAIRCIERPTDARVN